MKIKRKSLSLPICLILLFSHAGSLSAQEGNIGEVSEKSREIFVLLDTSESVLPVFNKMVNYIIGNIIEGHAKKGDMIRLSKFDSFPERIAERKLETEDDKDFLIHSLLLETPLGKYTDLIAALKYIRGYSEEIRTENKKEIFILTDGIHDPPPGTLYPEVTDKNGADILKEELKAISEGNSEVSFIRLPVTGDETGEEKAEGGISAEEEENDLFGNISEYGNMRQTDLNREGSLLSEENEENVPEAAEAREDEKEGISIPETKTPDSVTVEDIISILPEILAVVLILFLFYRIIKAILKKKSENFNEKIIEGSAMTGRRAIEMKVSGQNNRKLRNRNICNIAENRKYYIGRRGTYKIFLYKVPGKIAEICHKEGTYHFKPLSKEYMPSVCESTDFIDTPLKIEIDKNITLEIIFSEYIPPLEIINKILHQTETNGLPEDKKKILNSIK